MNHRTEYLKTGVGCPFCRNTDIEGGPVEIVGNAAFQDVSCVACGAKWQDEYRLVDAVVVTKPTEPSAR